ncbi:Amino acid ABC transporter membrane protein 1 (PAAT family) [Hyphomicrobiales bacterium]|nr:Amino acid ABC transporter membrane protein 1 (PAAT family) [Hyphomicrobiales bacterium]CAH1674660.1 Amino acid ABC transporter membrane protein 1 (PAAT family) [Hyphomicrobiales bacterium]
MLGLQFGPILAKYPAFLEGLWLTVQLSVGAITLGSFVGLIAAALRSMGPKPVQWIVRVYVEAIRNTPFLVQLYIIFFGLPSVGITISAIQASILAMTINLGAYSTEIFRAGIESIHRSQLEAGQSLALTRVQIFRHVVLVPAVAKVWPSLVSQFILIMLTSSVCSFISVEELSGAAYTIQSETFQSFEVYIIAGLLYLGLALILKTGLAALGIQLFGRKRVAKSATIRVPEVLP